MKEKITNHIKNRVKKWFSQSEYVDFHLNERLNELLSEWVDGWMNENTHKQVNMWMKIWFSLPVVTFAVTIATKDKHAAKSLHNNAIVVNGWLDNSCNHGNLSRSSSSKMGGDGEKCSFLQKNWTQLWLWKLAESLPSMVSVIIVPGSRL